MRPPTPPAPVSDVPGGTRRAAPGRRQGPWLLPLEPLEDVELPVLAIRLPESDILSLLRRLLLVLLPRPECLVELPELLLLRPSERIPA